MVGAAVVVVVMAAAEPEDAATAVVAVAVAVDAIVIDRRTTVRARRGLLQSFFSALFFCFSNGRKSVRFSPCPSSSYFWRSRFSQFALPSQTLSFTAQKF